jgi:hypothetical protein
VKGDVFFSLDNVLTFQVICPLVAFCMKNNSNLIIILLSLRNPYLPEITDIADK